MPRFILIHARQNDFITGRNGKEGKKESSDDYDDLLVLHVFVCSLCRSETGNGVGEANGGRVRPKSGGGGAWNLTHSHLLFGSVLSTDLSWFCVTNPRFELTAFFSLGFQSLSCVSKYTTIWNLIWYLRCLHLKAIINPWKKEGTSEGKRMRRETADFFLSRSLAWFTTWPFREKKSSSPRAATGGRLDWLIVNHQSGQHVCSSSGTQLRGTTYPSFNRGVFERKDFGVRVVISRTDQKTKKKKNLAEAEKMCSKEKKKNFFKRLLRGGTGFSFDFPF